MTIPEDTLKRMESSAQEIIEGFKAPTIGSAKDVKCLVAEVRRLQSQGSMEMKSTTINYSNMTPEQQKEFDGVFQEMDNVFTEMDKTFGAMHKITEMGRGVFTRARKLFRSVRHEESIKRKVG